MYLSIPEGMNRYTDFLLYETTSSTAIRQLALQKKYEFPYMKLVVKLGLPQNTNSLIRS